MARKYIFTSESVGEGHPDKVCDQISDSVLDAYLSIDPNSRVAVETVVKNNHVVLAGEVTSKANLHLDDVVRKAISDIGYNEPELGFDAATCAITHLLTEQSPDIAQGVNEGQGIDLEQGAGDQGLMFGYACNETPELMPLPISLSHKLLIKLSELRHGGKAPFIKPDAKAQVSIRYEDFTPKEVTAVVLSTQHAADISHDELAEFIKREVIRPTVPENLLTKETKYYINPTGRFVIGGPVGDSGLTGRKIIVDTYGGYARHGGGAFSGKDPKQG